MLWRNKQRWSLKKVLPFRSTEFLLFQSSRNAACLHPIIYDQSQRLGFLKKKLDQRGKNRPHSFQLRRGQLTPAEKTPESRLPGLDWRHLGPGPVRNLHGPGSVAQESCRTAKLNGSTARGFFPTGGVNPPRWGFEPPTCGVPPVASHQLG